MKEVYRLDKTEVPTMITSYDCVIKEIEREKDFLVFEDDISYHDSIRFYKPSAKSLTIKLRRA